MKKFLKSRYFLGTASGLFLVSGVLAYNEHRKTSEQNIKKFYPITKNFNEKRKNVITNVKYQIFMDLEKPINMDINYPEKLNFFTGSIVINFQISDKSLLSNEEYFLDYYGNVKSLIINGEKEQNIIYDENKIFLDSKKLKGENTIKVIFNSYYSKDGDKGLKYIEENGVKILLSYYFILKFRVKQFTQILCLSMQVLFFHALIK